MSMSIKLSDDLVKIAQQHGDVCHRSISKQIEYWSTIGRIAEENPELPYSFIKDVLLAQKETADGEVTPYQFG